MARSRMDELTDFEAWAGRILGVDLFRGVTTPLERRTRLRDVLRARDRGATRVVPGKHETWAELFERMYREPLQGESAEASDAP